MIDRHTQKKIDQIMDWFNFASVKKAMDALDWRWVECDGVPTEPEIRRFARKMLEQACKDGHGSGLGGFVTRYSEHEGQVYLSLAFVVANWDVWD